MYFTSDLRPLNYQLWTCKGNHNVYDFSVTEPESKPNWGAFWRGVNLV